MAPTEKQMPYGISSAARMMHVLSIRSVRLGKSGLKVSKIILGCMSYGSSKWQRWVLEEKEAIEHIKYACAFGVNSDHPVCAEFAIVWIVGMSMGLTRTFR